MTDARASFSTTGPEASTEWSRQRPGPSAPAGRLHMSFRKLVALLAAALLAILAWWLLATPQLGGGTSYIVTAGNSMEPRFHRGDLAVVRKAKRYSVGEIVLYSSPSLRRPVLHRIIVVDSTGYYFKGDHNDFVDPGPVPESALVGRLWLQVPKVGKTMSWASTPTHAALIASALTLFALLGGTRHAAHNVSRRRADRRRQGAGTAEPLREATGGAMTNHVGHHRLAWAASPIALAACAFALVVGLVHLGIGFTQPVRKQAPLADAYRHTGSFKTIAKLTHPNPAFPTGYVPIGQPVIYSIVDAVTVVFDYRLRTALPHSVQGTIGLSALVSSDTSYKQDIVLEKPVAFTGDTAKVSSRLSLATWQAFFKRLSIESGQTNSDYHIAFHPTIRVRGTVNGREIDERFSPSLPVVFTSSMMKMSVDPPPSLPGATYAPPTDGLALALNPVQSGTVPHIVTNRLTFLRYTLPVIAVRGIGIVFSVFGVLLLGAILFEQRRRPEPDHEVLVRAEYAHLVVPAAVVRPAGAATTLAEVPDFASLVRLALGYHRMILKSDGPDGTLYEFDDDGTTYRFVEPSAAAVGDAGRPASAPVEAAAPPIQADDSHRHDLDIVPAPTGRASARRHAWRVLLGVLAVAAACGAAAVGFTAGNVVPSSYVGAQTFSFATAQLAPAQCAGMVFDRLVLATGSSTSGSSQRDLILGRSGTGNRSFNGGGGSDCIVAGGGPGTTNSINGGSGGGDVCIGAPGAVNTFSNCETIVG